MHTRNALIPFIHDHSTPRKCPIPFSNPFRQVIHQPFRIQTTKTVTRLTRSPSAVFLHPFRLLLFPLYARDPQRAYLHLPHLWPGSPNGIPREAESPSLRPHHANSH
ncbi:hypothetical protein AVEN_135176-1 [Araneus ventricosus]|uniref:Uncharacterized protein n=1 Tax=Araneus ventricosus TaxID=182803 RepID=A0A4Y2IRK6_ARAVE|nr:hypothetical protein AVEN_135176-1 [Araneus ventricosus]